MGSGIISSRDFHISRGETSGQPLLDLLLGRDSDFNIPFDHSLAGDRVALLDIFGRETHGAAPANIARSDLHSALAAAPLTAAGLVDLN